MHVIRCKHKEPMLSTTQKQRDTSSSPDDGSWGDKPELWGPLFAQRGPFFFLTFPSFAWLPLRVVMSVDSSTATCCFSPAATDRPALPRLPRVPAASLSPPNATPTLGFKLHFVSHSKMWHPPSPCTMLLTFVFRKMFTLPGLLPVLTPTWIGFTQFT